MKTTLLGLGSFAMDKIIDCAALPAEDSFAVVTKERTLPGGSCANLLVTFAALGGESRMLAKIGDDDVGKAFRRTLKEDGVDDSFLLVKKGGFSLHTYVFTTPVGTHSILVNPGDAMMELGENDLTEEMLEGTDVFYSDLFPPWAAAAMAKKCRAKGIPVVLCMQCAPSFMHSLGVKNEEIMDAISLADLFISGREGLYELTGRRDYRQGARTALDRFYPSKGVICTAGNEGAFWIDGKEERTAPALKVHPVDSTGAGDSFTGALLYSYFHLHQGKRAALDFAAGAGALKCTIPGPRMRVNEKQLRNFIEENHSSFQK